MTLRRKTLMTVSAVFIGLLTILYFISQTLLMRSFTKLEEQSARQSVEQALNALSHDLFMLKAVTTDWAVWDDTYVFIEDVNKNYIRTNLVDGSFTGLRLNFMLFINSSGRMVYSKAFDLSNEEEMAVPQSLLSYLTPGDPLVSHSDPESIVSGIILLPEDPMLIVSSPILTSEEEGPIRGALIFGRYLDSSEIERLAELTSLSLTMKRYDYSPVPDDFQTVVSSLSEEIPVLVRPLDEQSIAGYALIRDVYDKPILLLRVDMSRDIYVQGQDTVSYFILSLLAISVVLGVVVMLFLDKQVLSRLTQLNRGVSNIGTSGDLSVRVPVAGEDELSNLGVAINVMVEMLEQSSGMLKRKNEQLDAQAKDLHSQAEELRSEITQRKQAEKALQESEEQYRDLFENANDLIQSVTVDGRFLYVNKAWREMLGYSEGEVANLRLWDIIHPDSIPHCREVFQKVVSGETLNNVEAVFVAKDGKLVTVEGNANCRYREGKVVATRGIFRDITERKRAEELYKTLTNSSPIGVYIVQDGKFRFVNPQFQKYTGFSEDELLDMEPLELVHPEDREGVRQNAVQMLKGNLFSPYEFRVVHHSGETRWAMETVTSIYYKEKRATLGNFLDITERKQAEEALRESEEKLRLMFESVTEGITITDLNGNVVDTNETTARMHGYDSKEQLIGRSAFELIAEGDHTRATENLKKTLEQGYSGTLEYTLLRADRSEFAGELNAALIRGKSGNPTSFVAITRDITERKRMEHELQEKNEQLDAQNEELQSQTEELMTQQEELIEKTREVERANQLKSEFLANMSHELRTPLNVIIGFSELMVDEVPGKINEEQRQCLTDVLTSSRHLLNLINGVLDLSRVESGKVELKPENVALPGVTASLTRTMMPILTPRKQSLDVEIEEGLSLVYADEGKLAQVLLNLVDNASKFSPDGSKMKIEAIRKGDWCQVSVIDNGIGIKKEDQERIFEPFSRLDNPLVKDRGGTGLGLALVKQIVERYGGQVWVESEYGKGSRFTFTVPLATSG